MTAGEVRVVWRWTSALTAADVDAALAVLSDDERAQHRRFHFADAAREYAAAHSLLRTTLSAACPGAAPREWRFDRGANGKPTVADGCGARPSVSLTHASGIVASAVASPDVALGVDAECDERAVDVDRLAARFFTEREAAALAALDVRARRKRFFDLWTLKEAVVKALGASLLPSLASVAFEIDDRAGGSIRFAGPLVAGRAWQVALFTPAAGYRIAVAARSTGTSPLPLTISCSPHEVLASHPAD
jgi:4'-phosphopantetheinyl transferase